METESQPFLPATDELEQQQDIISTPKKSRLGLQSPKILWVGTFAFLNVLALVSIGVWAASRSTAACNCAHLETGGKEELAGMQLRYVPTKSTDYTQTPYFGEPGNATDDAWEELLSGMFIQTSFEELDAFNQTSIDLPERGKHLAWLGVYHDLHCINTLRRWIHKDHYYPNLTEHEWNKFQFHTSHCLDMLRQAVQCQAGTYLMTFRWTDTEQKPVFNPKVPVRSCVDFDLLRESLKPRNVGMEEIHALKNPLLNKGG